MMRMMSNDYYGWLVHSALSSVVSTLNVLAYSISCHLVIGIWTHLYTVQKTRHIHVLIVRLIYLYKTELHPYMKE
jgi:hypothetical protein